MAQVKIEQVLRDDASMKKFIHVFDETTKNELLAKGYALINKSYPYIFRNKEDVDGVAVFESRQMLFTDVLHL